MMCCDRYSYTPVLTICSWLRWPTCFLGLGINVMHESFDLCPPPQAQSRKRPLMALECACAPVLGYLSCLICAPPTPAPPSVSYQSFPNWDWHEFNDDGARPKLSSKPVELDTEPRSRRLITGVPPHSLSPNLGSTVICCQLLL